MRDLLIVSGIAGLTVAAWTVSAGEGASGHGALHGGPAHGGFPAHMSHAGSHAEQMGIFFPSVPAQQFMNQLPGQPTSAPASVTLPTASLALGSAEHLNVGHVVSVAIHPIEHIAARVERGDVVIPQPDSAANTDSGSPAAKPNPPIANPAPARPPGAAGPGRRVSGATGPGQPGPGRLVIPRS